MANNRAGSRVPLAVAALAINGWTLAYLWAIGPLWGILGAIFVVSTLSGLFLWANMARKREARRAGVRVRACSGASRSGPRGW